MEGGVQCGRWPGPGPLLSLPRPPPFYTASMASTGVATAAFRARAQQEAERYGNDPWVFVRELIQNARDAGASRIEIIVDTHDGRERILCRDNGCGMTFEHARRYLFTLYASSKNKRGGAAGRFGIGFWSILRFAPDAITVRSRPAGGHGWQVTVTGDLASVERRAAAIAAGTEVVLERPARTSDLATLVRGAATSQARYLRRLGRRSQALPICVNGHTVNTPMMLPAPSLTFARRGLRGAVALGPTPSVELCAHGLLVRRASTLDELLSNGTPDELPQPSATAGTLAPQIVLDSDRLRVLLARNDAADDRELRWAVKVAAGEVRRLVRAQLNQSAPGFWLARSWRQLRSLATRPLVWLGAALLGAAVVLGVVIGVQLRSSPLAELAPAFSGGAGVPLDLPGGASGPGASLGSTAPVARYQDVAGLYRTVTLGTVGTELDLELAYQPTSARPWLALGHLVRVSDDGGVSVASATPVSEYRGGPCAATCIDLTLRLDTRAGTLRLPLATGHVLDPASVLLDGVSIRPQSTAAGAPVLTVRSGHTEVRYRSGPGAAVSDTSWRLPQPPASLAGLIAELAVLPSNARRSRALAWVAATVRYDRSPAALALYRREARRGTPLLERAVALGVGDCDIQSVLLASVLERAGETSRVALGVVGIGGRATIQLHAWVEALEADGRWSVLDPTLTGAAPIASSSGPPALQMAREPSRTLSASVPTYPRRVRLGVAVVGTAACFVLLALALIAVRTRRAISTEPQLDTTELIRAALCAADTLAANDLLLARPLVPLVGGRRLALDRCRELVHQGRMWVAREPVGRQLIGRMHAVIDGRTRAGALAAELLGARDLDRLSRISGRLQTSNDTALLESTLRQAGLRWRVRLGPLDDAAATSVPSELLGEGHGTTVIVGHSGALAHAFRRLLPHSPALAALALATTVGKGGDGTPNPPPRAEVLLARRALLESISRAVSAEDA